MLTSIIYPKKKSVKLLLQISTKQSYTSASTYIRMKKKSQCAVPENISKNGISWGGRGRVNGGSNNYIKKNNIFQQG